MDKENILYYQSNIKTPRDGDSVYAMKYANQQMLIDKLEQQCKKQKEVINKAVLELVNIDGNLSNSQLSDRICNLIDILNEVSE